MNRRILAILLFAICWLGIQPCVAGTPTLPPVSARILAVTVPLGCKAPTGALNQSAFNKWQRDCGASQTIAEMATQVSQSHREGGGTNQRVSIDILWQGVGPHSSQVITYLFQNQSHASHDGATEIGPDTLLILPLAKTAWRDRGRPTMYFLSLDTEPPRPS